MILDPSIIGCNSKPSFKQLSKILQLAMSFDVEREWSDLTKIGNDQAFSIDTVGVISKTDIELSVSSAIAHCSNDIVCGGYTPNYIASSLSFNPDVFSDKEQADLIGTLDRLTKGIGAQLGKSHTLYSNDNYITLTIIGSTTYTQPDIVPNEEYSLILTKQLGALRTYVLNDLKDQNSRTDSISRTSLMQGHIPILDVLKKATVATTDISGNGLIGTLVLLSKKFSLDISFNKNDLQVMGAEFGDIPLSNCASNKNRSSFDDAFYWNSSKYDSFIEEILFTPEYSGPLLMVVNKNKAIDVINLLKKCGLNHAHTIGHAQVNGVHQVVLNDR